MVHEGQSNYKDWQWDSITAVLSTSDAYNHELMCIAHSKNKYYGTIGKHLYCTKLFYTLKTFIFFRIRISEMELIVQ